MCLDHGVIQSKAYADNLACQSKFISVWLGVTLSPTDLKVTESLILIIIIIVTECIVYVQGNDPLTFSFLSFLFLIGCEFYGPSYLKC